MAECDDVLGTFKEVLILSLELVGAGAEAGGSAVGDLPSLVWESLQNEKVKKGLQDELIRQARALRAEAMNQTRPPGGNQQFSVATKHGDDALAPLKKIGSKAQGPAGKALLAEIKKTAEYKDLVGRVEKLRCSAGKTPVGIWIDEHKGLAIFVAVGIAVGGLSAMYVTRSGDLPAEYLLKVAKGPYKYKVGKLDLGTKVLKFEPSTRTIAIEQFAVAKWKPLQAKIALQGLAVEGEVGGTVTTELVVPVNKRNKFKVTGSVAGGAAPNLRSFSVIWTATPQAGLTATVQGGILHDMDGTSGSVGGAVKYKKDDLTITSSATHKRSPGQQETKVDFGLEWQF